MILQLRNWKSTLLTIVLNFVWIGCDAGTCKGGCGGECRFSCSTASGVAKNVKYESTVEDVFAAIKGTWEGRFPGKGDAVPEVIVRVEVSKPNGASSAISGSFGDASVTCEESADDPTELSTRSSECAEIRVSAAIGLTVNGKKTAISSVSLPSSSLPSKPVPKGSWAQLVNVGTVKVPLNDADWVIQTFYVVRARSHFE